MSNKVKRILSVCITAAFLIVGPMSFICGFDDVFADVGSIADGEDITYDKNGGVLASMGFDTSKMPETYDADATTNPYGSDVAMLSEVKEAVLFDMSGKMNNGHSATLVYGHDKKLNGSFSDFISGPVPKRIGSGDDDFIGGDDFVSAVKCDITGDGRDSALAIVYTHYNSDKANNNIDRNIYMCLYDPHTGIHSEPYPISKFTQDENGIYLYNFLIQSQLQITAGDYDKDSVDEIAVYSPAVNGTGRNKVMFFDLVDGKDCQNPYSISSWKHSWNYMLPVSNERVITPFTLPSADTENYITNMYNNLDITSGDADNDGICDLIISYGASDTDYSRGRPKEEGIIKRSIASRSVLLYGSDQGQMLKDSQAISYGGTDLIRVSFAFGDVDDDGNEDMFIAGQAQGEQDENMSRVIGRYLYDKESGEMTLETMQNLKIISGTKAKESEDSEKETFYSSNGWDGDYLSVPLMKTNLAVGNIMGATSNTKIYLDSVLCSYDNGSYEIVDELEDDSVENGSYKGSCVFGGDKAMKGRYDDEDASAPYFEFGADCGNFSASAGNYVLVNRVSTGQNIQSYGAAAKAEVTSSILYADNNGNLNRNDPIHGDSEYKGLRTRNQYSGVPVFAVSADTDVDGMVVEYTGEHNIQYQDPAVLAVLASPPYFKDVAAYDDNDMLVYLTTSYGTSSGVAQGKEYNFSSTLGGFFNDVIGSDAFHVEVNVSSGWARSETWGWEKERSFEMAYQTEAGEDAVVMYSIPTENYTYKVKGVAVDDDGNIKKFTNTMVIPKPHKPVTQTLTLEDYNEIQKRYSDKLPDVTKYLTSTPGDPSSYPKSEKDLPDEAKSHIDHDTYHPVDYAEKWAGVAFGRGSISQTISYSKEERDRYDNDLDGAFFSFSIGAGHTSGVRWAFFKDWLGGAQFEFSKVWGSTKATLTGSDVSGTIKNMPRDAKGYGYDFSWKLLKYNIKDKGCTFPVVTYIVNDVSMPPELPETIEQDFEKSTDSQIALTWTYSKGAPLAFDIYRYEDFPIGGGEELIGSVAGNDFKIMKDEDGNTLKDDAGHVIRGYEFIDTNLTADTKYEYRMKVRTAAFPGESIFSPVVEARTDVGTKPDLSLSTDNLTIYPDSTYGVKVNLADPENYQSNISYQWQKYDPKRRKWEDIEGCDKQILHFFNCAAEDAGTYRCRVNLVRKKESSPQYISAFTDTCTVGYSLRSVKFSDFQVFEGEGESPTNTGLYVRLSNTSQASLEKPTGMVVFDVTGPNGTIRVAGTIDEETGAVMIDSIEDLIEDLGQTAFVDAGYAITCSYEGSGIFYPAKDPEVHHYLKNIEESKFLSLKSSYYFGDDVTETMGLYDYKLTSRGVSRTDLTDRITKVRFYQADEEGINKIGDFVQEYVLSETSGKAPVPLNKKLSKRAYVEVYMDEGDDPAASAVIRTRKNQIHLNLTDKITGTGNMLEFLSSKDVVLSNGADPEKKNIETDSELKSLSDFMLFRYFEQNGDFICDSDDAEGHKDDFIPASYYASIDLKTEDGGDDSSWFYTPSYTGGRFMVVGNYYRVTALPKDMNTGSVRMISPDNKTDFTNEGYVGGTKIVLKAEPYPGYEISKWIIDDCGERTTVDGTEKLTYTVRSQNTEGNGEVRITAEMKPRDTRLKVGNTRGGTVTSNPEVHTDDNVLTGTKIRFTATPDPGWRFEEWRMTTLGGNNVVSGGVAGENGSNTKEFTMPDSSAEVYALFSRNSADVTASEGLEVLYVNNGGDPYHEEGELVMTEKGRNVPLGAAVTVRTKPGIKLASGASWNVSVVTDTDIVQIPAEETMSQGRSACTFDLPEDAISCIVSAETVKGKFTVNAETEGAVFTIFVDGQEMDTETAEGIVAGSEVDIRAMLIDRDRRITGWIINGEKKASTDTTYACNITENMNVEVTTEPVENYSMNISAKGGGTLKYIISDSEGIAVDTGYVGPEYQGGSIDVYPGESVLFRTSEEDEDFTLTAISLNGVKQDLDEGTFTIGSIDGDVDVLARFGTNTYYTADYSVSLQGEGSMLLDENDAEIADGKTVSLPKNGELMFSMVLPKESGQYVLINGERLTPHDRRSYDEDRDRYYYKTTLVSNVSIHAADHEMWQIGSKEKLIEYLNKLADAASEGKPYDQPDGILTADIDMEGEQILTVSDMYAHFDGNGHTISNMSLGSESGRYEGFRGIFGTIREGAYLRDIVFDNINACVVAHPDGCGLLSFKNYGTISRVTILNSLLDATHISQNNVMAGGLAFENLGLIEYCMVSKLTHKTDDPAAYNRAGAAGVVYNKKSLPAAGASMTGNYFEYLYVQFGDTDSPALARARWANQFTDIVALSSSGAHQGSFTANYFRQGFGIIDANGISTFSLTRYPDNQEAAEAEEQTAGLSRKLAYMLNDGSGAKVWGLAGNDEDDTEIYQLSRKDGYVPVKVDFLAVGKQDAGYYVPGGAVLSGEEIFGDKTPLLWEADSKAYPPGTTAYIDKDMVMTGIDDKSEYAVILSALDEEGNALSTVYYKDVDEAIRDASKDADNVNHGKEIQIIGEAALTGDTLNIDEKSSLIVRDGAELTVSRNTQINNKGTIHVETGGTVRKYGSLMNEGQVTIDEGSDFYNYGSAFADKGEVAGKQNIICKPHIFGEWIYADTPDDQGRWIKTSTCTICEETERREVQPDPHPVNVDSIEITRVPDKTVFEVGDSFVCDGILVTANLTDGTRAPVTQYTLALRLGDEEKAISNGDVLNDEGTGKVIVTYDRFRTEYEVEIINTAELLTLTDGDGNEITESEMDPGDELSLKASLKSRLPYKTRFSWTTGSDSIAAISPNSTGTSCMVTAGEPGKTTVTVTVTDEKGRPIQSVKSRSVEINCVSRITDVKITEEDIGISKGESHEIKHEITPSNTTETVAWSTSDESVAVVDENGVVTGTGGGTAVITVTAPDGLSDSRKVYVYEKAEDLSLMPEGMTIDEGAFDVIWALATNAGANGEVVWTIDDPSKAAFYVRNEETGEMETTDTVTSKLSADGMGSSGAFAIIAGISKGTAMVTARTESEGGGMIDKTCAVEVNSSEKYVRITLNGVPVSGEVLELDLSGKKVQFGVDHSEEIDSFNWDAVDDQDNPVIKIGQDGTVEFRRKGSAVIRVTSELTGETDICVIKVVSSAKSVELSDNEIQLEAGESYKLRASLVPEDSDGKVIWSSSDESVATVSADGKVTAAGAGEAIITAAPDADGAEAATCKVTVRAADPEVRIDSSSRIMLEKGKKVQLSATVTLDNFQGKIIWKSSDNTIASVTSDGIVTGLKEGECDITASIGQSGSKPAICHVTVYESDTEPAPDKGDTPGGKEEVTPAPGGKEEVTPAPAPAPGSDPNQKGKDGTAVGEGASAASADKAIKTMKTDTDPAGSVFGKLRLRSQKQTKTAITLKWTKVSKAKKYVIYGNKCGKTAKPKKLATVTGKNTKVFKTVAGKKLKKGTYYKFIIVALDKNNNVVSTSKLIHVAVKGGKVGNHRRVTVTKSVLAKAKMLKKGKTLKLNAKGIAQTKKLKVRKHAAIRYESSNKKIATVTKKGVVRAKKKGSCYIYAFAQNGVFKKIKVVVK